MLPYQKDWANPDTIYEFAKKAPDEFFLSEKYFVSAIRGGVKSVLDIGCASGRFIDFFKQYVECFDYCGVDVCEESVLKARQLYPKAHFLHGDALDVVPARQFDLVNATGVMQHEPRFTQLIERMIQLSARYVMFDVKFAAIDENIVDRKRSSAGKNGDLYYNLLSPSLFLPQLRQFLGIRAISVYGYPTSTHKSVRLTTDVGQIVSAGVLLELGEGERTEKIELPQFLGAI